MKKGYKKLLILELIIFSILGINSFIYNFLTGYRIVFFLIFILVAFKLLLGFEKDRHRYVKDFILDEVVMLIAFLLVTYFLGIMVGFIKTEYSFNIIKQFILPSVLYIILREFFRYLALTKGEGNTFLTVLTILLFIFIDITSNLYLSSLNTKYSIFIFIATILLPAIFNNIAFSYVTKKIGYKPVLFYCLVMELYGYILPISPDLGQYIGTIVLLVMPTIFCIKVNNFFESIKKQELNRNTIKKKRPFASIILASIIIVVISYYTSGHFNHWAIVIASNSMVDKIQKGDIVIIDKVNNHYEKIDVGQILAYRYNNKIIVHRVVERIEIENQYYFKTKGDANSSVDQVLIDEEMVVGTVNVKIPYIGLPTVWLKSL